MISVRLGAELEARVKQAARSRGMSVSAFVRMVVERALATDPKQKVGRAVTDRRKRSRRQHLTKS
jgi:antitoxin component of RelBE/YafQ-DinJ toxin-antitoxin module